MSSVAQRSRWQHRLQRLRSLGSRPIDVVMVIDPRHGRERHLRLVPRRIAGGAFLALVAIFGTGWVGARLVAPPVDPALVDHWRATLEMQQIRLDALSARAETRMAALTRRFGELNGRLLRMEALGERVARAAEVDTTLFALEAPVAVGGPAASAAEEEETAALPPLTPPEFVLAIDDLSARVLAREQQLLALQSVVGVQRHEADTRIAGRPVVDGWRSSAFGRRVDPFDGSAAWHAGVDFAGRDGDPVVAVGAGVVTHAGRRQGYGHLVEIAHGNGHVTRYGHNRDLLVGVGDTVERGQVIARMGSSGRATGPHVHFEVLKDDRQVDPATYIARAVAAD